MRRVTLAMVMTLPDAGRDACRLSPPASIRNGLRICSIGVAMTARPSDDGGPSTEMLQLRLMEKKKELVRQTDVDELIDGIVGVMLTHLSSMPAQCAPIGDLATRRRFEQWVFQTRTAIADAAQKKADEQGEPPLEEQ